MFSNRLDILLKRELMHFLLVINIFLLRDRIKNIDNGTQHDKY